MTGREYESSKQIQISQNIRFDGNQPAIGLTNQAKRSLLTTVGKDGRDIARIEISSRNRRDMVRNVIGMEL